MKEKDFNNLNSLKEVIKNEMKTYQKIKKAVVDVTNRLKMAIELGGDH